MLNLMGSLVADESFKSRRFLEQWVSKYVRFRAETLVIVI